MALNNLHKPHASQWSSPLDRGAGAGADAHTLYLEHALLIFGPNTALIKDPE